MKTDLDILAQKANYGRDIEIFIKSGTHLVSEIILEPWDNIKSYPPLFTINLKAGQKLMDDLWASGIRPTESKMGDLTISSMNLHLSDMRSLVQSVINETPVSLKGIEDSNAKRT